MAECPGCGKVFGCDIEAGESRCWCFDVDASPLPKRDTERCYCEECLTGGSGHMLADMCRKIAADR